MDIHQTDRQEFPLGNPYENPENYSGFVIIQLSKDYIDVESETLPEMAERQGLEDLLAVEAIHHFPSRRLITSRAPEDILQEDFLAEEAKADSLFPPLFFVQSWRLDVRQEPEMITSIVDELRFTHGVTLVYPELIAHDPDVIAPDDDPHFWQQGYLQAAEVGGIDAIFAWTHPHGSGEGVRVADVEQGWDLNNIEFLTKEPVKLWGDIDANESYHGTAVLGILIADDNAVGGIGVAPMKGASPEMEMVYVSSHYQSSDGSNGHVADAIEAAIPHLNRGDILLIEVEQAGNPAEIIPHVWEAIWRAVSIYDIIVIEAAGNGGVNLDEYGQVWDPFAGIKVEPFNRDHPNFANWDSGSILVGAADWDGVNKIHTRSHYGSGGSNHGRRVDCFSWGNDVATIDVDNPDAGPLLFSGTSAASAIIAGAAVLLQSIYRHLHSGASLSPQEMREILSNPATGTPQEPGEAATEPIGVMPDLRKILTDDPGFQS